MMIRKARATDIDELRRIYDSAKKYMDENGNPTQWVKGHPSNEELEEDIGNGILFVIEEENRPCASFVFYIGDDPNYKIITDGKWDSDKKYGVIHRVASDGTRRGIFKMIFAFAKDEIKKAGVTDLRIDTHRDNKKMQKVVTEAGFKRQGTIFLSNGSPRIAFWCSTLCVPNR